MSDNPASAGAAPSAAPSAPSAPPASAIATPAAPSSSTPSAPVTSTQTQPTQAASNEPPQERWPDILDNARKKTRAEVEAEYRSRYQKYDAFEQDPWGAMQQWLGAAAQHSLYGPLVKQWAQGQVEPPPQAAEPEADVPIVDESGRVTGQTYSAKQLKKWQEWNEARLQRSWDERFGPVEQQTQRFTEVMQEAQNAAQSSHWAQQTLGALRTQPYFKEHEPAIRQALADHEEWGDNIHAAYNHVLVTQILPNLSNAEAKQVLDSLNTKAGAGTVTPGSQAAGTPQFKNFREAVEYYNAHPEEAQAMASRR